MRNLPQLMSACYNGINNPDFAPQKDESGNIVTTFCNQFVDSVAQAMGCKDLTGRMANEIIDFISASPDWSTLAMMDAQSKANMGSLVIAGLQATPHGHVCVLVPGLSARSVHWAMQNALCANVGETVFIGKGLSFAFREIPHLFVWRASL